MFRIERWTHKYKDCFRGSSTQLYAATMATTQLNNDNGKEGCARDAYQGSFTVHLVTGVTPFQNKLDAAHMVEKSRHLVERINRLDPFLGRMFHSKRLHDNPPFRLLFENQPKETTNERPYIALSYCWHNPSEWTPAPACTLGRSQYHERLPISDLCFQKVLELREPEEGIWFDQLCIVQEDEEEKKHAIASMDLVYKHARLIAVVIEDTTMSKNETFVIEKLHGIGLQNDNLSLFTKCLSESGLTVWNAISKIGHSRWFQRAWCSHEFHLCNDAVFIIPCEGRSPLSLRLCTLEKLLQFKVSWVPVSVELSNDSLEGYRKLFFPVTARHILLKSYTSDKPILGVCYLINDLETLELGDKVSIALNLLDLGLYFRGTISSKAYCRYIFAILALAAGDPLVLCCSGKPLDNDLYERTKESLDLACLQWPLASNLVHFSNRYPRAVRQLSDKIAFQRGRITTDVLVLPKLICEPSNENIVRSRNFFQSIFEDQKTLASMEPEEWAHPVLNKEMILRNGTVYLAHALGLGVDWMSTALKSMKCSATLQGLRANSWAGDGDTLWHLARMHLFSTNAPAENFKAPLVDFFTFAFQHILLLGETAQNIATVTFPGSLTRPAMVSLPPGHKAENLLLAVPVSLSEPENAFIKRLWLLEKEDKEPYASEMYCIRSKGYLWGCGTLYEDNGTMQIQRCTYLKPHSPSRLRSRL